VGGPSNEGRVGKVNPDENGFGISAAGILVENDGNPVPTVVEGVDVAAANGEGAAFILL
jgi:hypothetical protein